MDKCPVIKNVSALNVSKSLFSYFTLICTKCTSALNVCPIVVLWKFNKAVVIICELYTVHNL